jgi:hypothetical protein
MLWYSPNTWLQDNVYNESESLWALVSRLLSKSGRTTDADILNLIVKYAVSFFCNTPITSVIKKWEVELCIREVKRLIGIRLYHQIPMLYPMAMVCDFPKTLAISKEILTYQRANTENQHVGYDLWTGTGILLLLQAIRAHNLGISIDTNLGLEIEWDVTKRTRALVEELSIGSIQVGDTTKFAYAHSATFFTNENLPKGGVPFIKDGKIEPFFQNISQILWVWVNIKECHHFPYSVTCQYTHHDRQKSPETFTCNPWNSYATAAIKDMDDPEILRRIAPLSISLGGIDNPLSKIGAVSLLSRLKQIPLCVSNGIERW